MPWSIKNLMFHDKPVPLLNQRSLGYKKVWVYASNAVHGLRSSWRRCHHGLACAGMKCVL